MTAVTVEYKVSFGKGAGQPSQAKSPGGNSGARPAPGSKEKSSAPRIARLLALAHYIDRAVDSGLIKDYAAAARLLTMSRGRMSQVMKLLMLSPGIQEEILLCKTAVSERNLRPVCREVSWEAQMEAHRALS
jgi:hypothetical protein